MPRKKRSSKSGGLPGRIQLIMGALVVVAVAGVLLVSFLQSPRGRVFLLDLGFTGRYEAVQGAIDVQLKRALRDLELDKTLQEKTSPVTVGGREVYRREWNAKLERSRSIVRVNLALTEAVRRAGVRVRSSKEEPGGGLVLEVGSRRYTTHRIRILPAHPAPEEARREQTGAAGQQPGAAGRPKRIALVIDDFGYTADSLVAKFLDMDVPLTISVIPSLRHSRDIVEQAAEKKKEAILHLPMEAESFTSEVAPVLTSMSDAEIDSLVEKYLEDTPGVRGANNHLGSIATQDARVMEAVLGVFARHRLFFLDSLTSNKSIAYTTAKSLGVPAARNDLFIDADTENRRDVEARLDRLLAIAKTRGTAIGIGHPRSWTYDAIRAWRERVKDSGVELVFVSQMVE
jgi:polysaccharide deacetylase 2 family uncharacterized protein YibQ